MFAVSFQDTVTAYYSHLFLVWLLTMSSPAPPLISVSLIETVVNVSFELLGVRNANIKTKRNFVYVPSSYQSCC